MDRCIGVTFMGGGGPPIHFLAKNSFFLLLSRREANKKVQIFPKQLFGFYYDSSHCVRVYNAAIQTIDAVKHNTFMYLNQCAACYFNDTSLICDYLLK
jgi:hypothetical protein